MKKDGGPAFPSIVQDEEYSSNTDKYVNVLSTKGGMTLRDYFAAAALPSIISNGIVDGWPDGWNDPAAEAYIVADAMIVEREKLK